MQSNYYYVQTGRLQRVLKLLKNVINSKLTGKIVKRNSKQDFQPI